MALKNYVLVPYIARDDAGMGYDVEIILPFESKEFAMEEKSRPSQVIDVLRVQGLIGALSTYNCVEQDPQLFVFEDMYGVPVFEIRQV